MEKKKYKLLKPSDLTDATAIHPPGRLSAEEEAEILQAQLEQLDPEEFKRELESVLRQAELGRLVSAEQLLEELEREERAERGEENGKPLPP